METLIAIFVLTLAGIIYLIRWLRYPLWRKTRKAGIMLTYKDCWRIRNQSSNPNEIYQGLISAKEAGIANVTVDVLLDIQRSHETIRHFLFGYISLYNDGFKNLSVTEAVKIFDIYNTQFRELLRRSKIVERMLLPRVNVMTKDHNIIEIVMELEYQIDRKRLSREVAWTSEEMLTRLAHKLLRDEIAYVANPEELTKEMENLRTLVSKAISGKCGIIVHTLKFTRVNITNEKRDHRRLQVDMEETLTEFATDFAEETNSGMGFTPKKDI